VDCEEGVGAKRHSGGKMTKLSIDPQDGTTKQC
jgi:hypothetical protein